MKKKNWVPIFRELGMPPSITNFVRGHVQAKRYLGMATEHAYMFKLKAFKYKGTVSQDFRLHNFFNQTTSRFF